MNKTAFILTVTLLTAAGTSLVAPTAAAAQEPSRSELAAARRLFRQGMRAGQQENWVEARDAFAQAYEIVPRPRVLLNLASAQMHTGQLIEAAESYQAFLGRVTEGPDMQYRAGVEVELAGLEQRTPRIRIEAPGLRDDDQLRIDGGDVSRGALDLELPLNPGQHAVSVTRGADEIAREEFALEEGQVLDITLDAVGALPSPTLADEGGEDLLAPTDDDGSGGVLTSPWFWGGVGAVVVTAVIIGVAVAASGGDPERQSGNLGGGRLVIE